MKPKNHSRTPLAAVLAVAALITSAQAAVVFSTAGAASYTYSASGGSSTLPPALHAPTQTNITIARYTLFPTTSPNVRGLTNVGGQTGTIVFHFQTGPGLTFSNNINLTVGTGRHNAGSITASYDHVNTFNSPAFTTWGTNTNPDDLTFNATNVAAGKTDLFVRFQITGATAGNAVITWGGSAGERSFALSGTVVPEPSSALLGGLGMLLLLRRRRN